MPDSSGTYQTAEVSINVLHPGDSILLHSGKRRKARKVRILRKHDHPGEVRLDTTVGRVVIPAGATVDAILERGA